MADYDVIVVGAGMVGMSSALDFVKKQKKKIAIIDNKIIEPKISKDFHTRVSAINIASENYLKELSVWQNIIRKRPFNCVKVWDQNSHGSINFHAKEENLTHLGNIIENDVIKSALYKEISKNDITIITDNLENIEKNNDYYKIILKDNKEITCSLLIGADGVNSKIRTLAGIECDENNYQQKAIIANISSAKNFSSTISQRFLTNSIIAILPLSDKQASIVWSCNNDLAKSLIKANKSDFAQQLNLATEYYFGELKLISERLEFALTAKSAKKYTTANLALIGDAAHNIHPLAGQGVNLGLADAKALNISLYKNENINDYFQLAEYEKNRKMKNEIMAKTMSSLDWIYKNNNEIIRLIRGSGMNFIDNSEIIKSFLQKNALGE